MSTTPSKKTPLEIAIDIYVASETLPDAKGLGIDGLSKEMRHRLSNGQEFTKEELKALEQIQPQFFQDNNLFLPALDKDNPQQAIREAKSVPPLLAAVAPALRALGEDREAKEAKRLKKIEVVDEIKDMSNVSEIARSKDGFSKDLRQNDQELTEESAKDFATGLATQHPLLPALLVCKEKSFVMPMLLAGNNDGPNGRKLSEDILDLATIAKDTQKFFQDNKMEIRNGWEEFSKKHEGELCKLEGRFIKAIENQAQEPKPGEKSIIPETTRANILEGVHAFTKDQSVTLPLGLSPQAAELAIAAAAELTQNNTRARSIHVTTMQRPKRPLSPQAQGQGSSN